MNDRDGMIKLINIYIYIICMSIFFLYTSIIKNIITYLISIIPYVMYYSQLLSTTI